MFIECLECICPPPICVFFRTGLLQNYATGRFMVWQYSIPKKSALNLQPCNADSICFKSFGSQRRVRINILHADESRAPQLFRVQMEDNKLAIRNYPLTVHAYNVLRQFKPLFKTRVYDFKFDLYIEFQIQGFKSKRATIHEESILTESYELIDYDFVCI